MEKYYIAGDEPSSEFSKTIFELHEILVFPTWTHGPKNSDFFPLLFSRQEDVSAYRKNPK
ncbi:hypothetical protein [Chryseobacterium nepalense]|uniref:hypothetical protein n=1 Tax=Chryseobacterium nepalense TaxID=1854498 RepID=UPI002E095860|nr:hypothetical protein [Chryseobacterium nepalense]